jgi:hypothetical protein
MKRGPSGKVVCCICRKWLDRSAAVGLDDRHVHVDHCFARALAKIASTLNLGGDMLNFAVSTAYKVGRRGGR